MGQSFATERVRRTDERKSRFLGGNWPSLRAQVLSQR